MTVTSNFHAALVALQTYGNISGPCHLTLQFTIVQDPPRWCCMSGDHYQNLQDITDVYTSTILEHKTSLQGYSSALLRGARLGLIRLGKQYWSKPISLRRAIHKLTNAVLGHVTQNSRTVYPL